MAPRAAVFSAFLLLGCFPPGEGIEPPRGRVYFPVGLAVDQQQKFLYIVNSDFDLQFNAGTVQSWDLDRLRARVPRYCESNADCMLDPNGRTECDLVVRKANGSEPSHWCVVPGGRPCGELGEQSNRDQSLYPGRCGFIDQLKPQDDGLPILPTVDGAVPLSRAVQIGAFATDVVRRTRPVAPAGWDVDDTAGGLTDALDNPNTTEDERIVQRERLFIPVRGDATLHWIDIDRGDLHCGQAGNDGACNDAHRAGDQSEEENTRADGRLGPEPFGLDADENGLTLMVTNQTSGAVALFSHLRKTGQDEQGNPSAHIQWNDGPRYVFREGGLPERPIGVANVPVPLASPTSGRDRLPGYLVSFRNAAAVFLFRVYDDAAADPARPYTRSFESEAIFTNSSGIDSRGLAVDAFHRKAAERDCLERHGIDERCAVAPEVPECAAAADPGFQSCLADAAAVPLDVFVANRSPATLIPGRSQPLVSDAVTSDLPDFGRPVPLDVGPSRVYVGDIINERGERERRVFVVCFDSRRIAVYDPERQRLETEIITGRGPHGFALDIDINAGHAYAYVGHFLDSYVGVVDLDQRHRGQYGAMIATVGKPSPPRASK